MRSEQIHRALAQGHSRFEICQLVSKSVKRVHKIGARFEDTIGYTLEYLGPAHPRSEDGTVSSTAAKAILAA
jgi:hypothetical protein